MNSRRPSRDSLRNLPSPKPAPVSTLPEIPSARGVPKALRSVPALSIAPMSPSSSSSSPQSPSHRPSYSAPPYAPVASTSSPTHSRRMSYISFSSTGTSVRTSRKRTAHRSDALAHLEGRAGMPRRTMPPRARNFMNMTDDEDEEDDFHVAPRDVAHSRLTVPASIHMQVPPSSPTYYDDEDRVLPAPITHSRSLPQSRASMSSLSPPPSVKGGRRRRSTIESWFPLANFIDLKDDDLASWRGLVEIASAL
ncbi:hypothetical protein BV25DRAFT_1828062 [Artomyces pyxidatus]|uniref:Uncharacterized protein n=1 Tax=Artomyces pyxidatus TaxID=48021 RepID=A0ACB8SUH0_9AGAM|nr:hypothetical protein BV25DRAFT_1828062 [Artomyces pyxidatus]